MKKICSLILAAGAGTRMKSDLPKVLHTAAGDTLLGHVLRAVFPVTKTVGVVLGHGAERVRAKYKGSFYDVEQKKRLGSGHAVMMASRWLGRQGGTVMVLCGDAPLVQTTTLRRLLEVHRREKNAATILTARVGRPQGYGRIVRNSADRPVAIVEEKDATSDQRAIDEINSGAYCFETNALLPALKKIRPNNVKGEYYLTDVIGFLVEAGLPVGAYCAEEEEILGVNHRAELALADRILRRRILNRWMAEGVTVVDPESTYVDVNVTIGRDTVLYPQTFLQGRTRVGDNARIGPYCFIDNCQIRSRAEVRAVFAYDSTVGEGARVGPYAHLRPGTRIGAGAHVGNFVELKKTDIGPGSKANHLAYLGDARLGRGVNIGAGVITCNYDGFQKHRTVVGHGAFIGSNVNLVAPLRVGAGAIVGAGSTIVHNVPSGALALERARPVIKKDWARKKRRLQKSPQHRSSAV